MGINTGPIWKEKTMKKKRKKRSNILKDLTTEWGKIVKHNAGYVCELPGCSVRTGLNAHHIVGKRNMRLRNEVRNGIALCSKHHTLGRRSAHQDPKWFEGEILNSERREDFLWCNGPVKEETYKATNSSNRELLKDMKKRVKDLEDKITISH